VKNNTTDVAGCPSGRRLPWCPSFALRRGANLSPSWGANHARTQTRCYGTAGSTDARRLVSWPLPAQPQQIALMSAELLPAANDTRTQKKRSQKTRINTPAVTARWVHILNGNNRPRKAGQHPRKAVDPHIGSAAKLFCRPGPNRPAPVTTGNAKREGDGTDAVALRLDRGGSP